jgi:hypothetical protein
VAKRSWFWDARPFRRFGRHFKALYVKVDLSVNVDIDGDVLEMCCSDRDLPGTLTNDSDSRDSAPNPTTRMRDSKIIIVDIQLYQASSSPKLNIVPKWHLTHSNHANITPGISRSSIRGSRTTRTIQSIPWPKQIAEPVGADGMSNTLKHVEFYCLSLNLGPRIRSCIT